jgi:hypothetical protein
MPNDDVAPANIPTRKPGRPKRGRGQPKFVPSKEQRNLVKLLIGYGIPQDRVCLAIPNKYSGKPISKNTLERAFEQEIISGMAEMDAMCAVSLHRRVREGNMTAIIWYMKNRMGWRDTFAGELSGPNGSPLSAPSLPPVLKFVFTDTAPDADGGDQATDGTIPT